MNFYSRNVFLSDDNGNTAYHNIIPRIHALEYEHNRGFRIREMFLGHDRKHPLNLDQQFDLTPIIQAVL